MEIESGFRAGWWRFNNSSKSDPAFSSQNLDYSHLSPFIPLRIAVGKQFGSIRLLAGADYTWFLEYELRKHQNALHPRQKYSVAERNIGMVHVFGGMEIPVITSRNFALLPVFKAGWLGLLADHPDQEKFKNTAFWEGGIAAEWPLLNGQLQVKALYQSNSIQLQDKDIHSSQIFSFGLGAGFRIML